MAKTKNVEIKRGMRVRTTTTIPTCNAIVSHVSVDRLGNTFIELDITDTESGYYTVSYRSLIQFKKHCKIIE